MEPACINGTGKAPTAGNVLKLDRNPEPLQACIAVMLKIALAKGWTEVEGEGSESFLLSLWVQAEAMRIEARARPEQSSLWLSYLLGKQQQILDKHAEDRSGTEKSTGEGGCNESAGLQPRKPGP